MSLTLMRETGELADTWLEYTDRDVYDFARDYGMGFVAFGVPDALLLGDAIRRGDKQDAAYYAGLMVSIHAAWASGYYGVKAWELVRHARTVPTMHHMLRGKNALMGQVYKKAATSFMVPALAAREAMIFADSDNRVKEGSIGHKIGEILTYPITHWLMDIDSFDFDKNQSR